MKSGPLPSLNSLHAFLLQGYGCLAVILMILGCSPASQQGSEISRQINAYLEPYVGSRSFSGTVLVVRDDVVLHHRGYGMADVERGVSNDVDVRYQIASMSKSFTAAAILLLWERGLLGLEDPASRFVEGFPHESITVEQLLTHTSGLPRYVFQSDYPEHEGRFHTTRDLVDWIADRPLASEPGSSYGYSGANYALLAHIIEEVSGVDYADFLSANVFDPLGLRDTGHRGASTSGVDRLALGYTPVGLDRLERARPYDYSIDTGGGSLYSTTSDLVAWYEARNAGRLLSESTRQSMTEAADTPLGYAWNVTERLGRQAVTLTGWDGVGFGSQFVHFPEDDTTIVVLSNLNMSSIAGEVADNVASIIFGEEYDALEILERPAQDEATLRQLAGTYRFGADFYVPGTTIRFEERDGQLIVPAEPPAPEGGLLPLSDGSFIHRQQWLRLRFEHDDDGAVTGIRYAQFRARKESS